MDPAKHLLIGFAIALAPMGIGLMVAGNNGGAVGVVIGMIGTQAWLEVKVDRHG